MASVGKTFFKKSSLMANKRKSKAKILTFLVLINIAVTSAQTQCHEGQFLSTFTGGCSDCPDDPKTNCKYEGDDAQPCEDACITGE
jgi:hypothetical protein